jgi:EAL domain-containing protein (putative c-di-GMP-specific phosphodiesterase class I)
VLANLISQDIIVQGARFRIGASIGIAMVGADGMTSQELLARADTAMYRAKDEGRGRARAYDPQADAEAQSRSGWQRRIRDALSEDRLVVHAQPIVQLPQRSIAMYEALVRMVLPNGEIVGPSSFLGVAERSGSITDIDCWVLARAIAMIAEARAGGEHVRITANVSGRSLADRERLVELIAAQLDAHDVPGERLIIEITETAAMQDRAAATEFAQAVRALGCTVALDDFGVGFSSFAQLKQLPVDYLKIDGSFVVNLARDRTDQQLVATMTAAAHALGKQVIAEFVSDEETLRLLGSFGVDFVQGYYLGEPKPYTRAARAA